MLLLINVKSDLDLLKKISYAGHSLNHLLPPKCVSHNLRERGHIFDLLHFNTALHKNCNLVRVLCSISIHLTLDFISAIVFYIHWIFVFFSFSFCLICASVVMLLLYMSFCVRVTHFITIDRPTIVNKAVIVASRSVDYDCDCVAFVLLSHGEDEGMIHGTDNVVAIDSLLKPLKHEDNMKHFAGKPKVVFVQVITALSLSLSFITVRTVLLQPHHHYYYSVVLVVQWFGVGLVIVVRLPAGALSSQLGQLSLPSLRGR